MLKSISQIFLMISLIFGAVLFGNAQGAEDKSKRPSPPAQVSETIDGVKVTIDYSQPSVKGRKIWGGLVPYNKLWRTGANEATWMEVDGEVNVGGLKLQGGKYAIFTIPTENEWTIILNKEWNQWGGYDYNEEKDIARFKVKPVKSDKFYEKFTITIDKDGLVKMNWADLSIPFDIDKS